MNTSKSTSHQKAFQDLSMVEVTVLDFLEAMESDAESDLQEAIETVRGEIVGA